MDIVGIGGQEQQHVFQLLGAILHLGNVGFQNDQRDHASVVPNGALEHAATLLGCVPKELEKALLTKELRTGGSDVCLVQLDAAKAMSRYLHIL
jgi:myosin heavy subunit